MKAGRDFSCEIMGLIVLMVLSALSHVWFILIAIGIMAAIAGAGLLIAMLFLRIGRELLARVLNPVPHENSNSETAISLDVARDPGPSLPVTYISTIRD
jgi:hypothetical protein